MAKQKNFFKVNLLVKAKFRGLDELKMKKYRPQWVDFGIFPFLYDLHVYYKPLSQFLNMKKIPHLIVAQYLYLHANNTKKMKVQEKKEKKHKYYLI